MRRYHFYLPCVFVVYATPSTAQPCLRFARVRYAPRTARVPACAAVRGGDIKSALLQVQRVWRLGCSNTRYRAMRAFHFDMAHADR